MRLYQHLRPEIRLANGLSKYQGAQPLSRSINQLNFSGDLNKKNILHDPKIQALIIQAKLKVVNFWRYVCMCVYCFLVFSRPY